ncbi:hypothetical protein TPHA_0C01270 [Tetrapisispora phaffii CBS 4417]|uniref:Calcineurin-like phosphoesterase domain-containing protein n=1 Tax=Tetrapisispora phaffii (strain ATCC 24235 / CBS 4417 / NBRC 1672 / NRRL Y-8282 / UCD 70-5) TaxID=1071381 RepID=G8BRA7_TETPH|nr:hypothetical protein TPHA_0C01270 [Tetrapisispora phaffii CBS 4417]CCE62283.1 hypothetical protein TPHA_0C01270 [Tetrapisispora phaffii CBS 4417]
MVSAWFKYFTYLVTISAVLTNVYLYTFPSFHVKNCTWKCFDQEDDEPAFEEMSIMERMIYKINQYKDDVQEQVYSTKNYTSAEGEHQVRMLAFGDPQIRGIWKKSSYLAMLDVYANDCYLGHIYSMMKERLSPTHVATLGDLFSSQWISDSEFYNRTTRYVTRLYNRDTTNLVRLKKESEDEKGQYRVDWQSWGDDYNKRRLSDPPAFDYGYSDVYSWDPEHEDFLFINVTGNHDIGYSGDVTYQHMSRFSHLFGKDNYWVEYDAGTDHAWRLVVLNSLLLDGPALQPEFVEGTWAFLRALENRNFTGSTVLLTHVPFYKEAGLCADGPMFSYYPDVYEREPYKVNLLRAQNHLSKNTTDKVLSSIFNNDRPGIILTGHDHVGCETVFNRQEETKTWNCTTDMVNSGYNIREVTVRSMMGEFGGNTGVFTGHFNKTSNNWEWNFTLCPFALQQVWWLAKTTIGLSLLLWPIYILF